MHPFHNSALKQRHFEAMRRVPAVLLGVVLLAASAASVAADVSFRNDVMAVLSKAGCNAGTCHGNRHGKGGFKLSLRGENPGADYVAVTRDTLARRLNPLDPDQSLVLLKPTTQIAHEGGLRFSPDSDEYKILRRWIARGAPLDLASAPTLEHLEVTPLETIVVEPQDQVQLQVKARFAGGGTRDVTRLAVYEPANSRVKVTASGLVQRQGAGLVESTVLVRYLDRQEPVRLAFVPNRPGFDGQTLPADNYIDQRIFAKLRALRLNPSGLCSDQVFMRRAYLDLLGILPTAAEARSSRRKEALTSSAPRSRQDPKLPTPESATAVPPLGSSRREEALTSATTSGARNQSLLTSAATETKSKRARLIDQLLERPEFADFWALKWADLLRVEAHSLDAKGVQNFHHWIRRSIAENKPLDLFVRELITARGSTYTHPPANYYRPNRDGPSRSKAAAQVFLGTRLQCAECHNHPFDRWTQDDFYDWAALFARVNYKVVANNRDIGSDRHEWKGEQIVYLASKGSVKNPRTGKPAQPRLLGEPGPGRFEDQDELEALARWLTRPENPRFARVQANRIWSQLMGRGLVDPPDDFRPTNPASHPELLDQLAEDFVQHRFDLRHLIRRIMNSRAYQLAAEPNATNAGDEANYSHALVRRLSAEQLLDCQSQVASVPLKFAGYPPGLRAAQLPGVRPEAKGKRRANSLDQFLEIFGKPPRLLSSDTERSCECNMGQAFQLISGPIVNDLLAEKDNRVSRLLAAGRSDRQIIEELFWTALTRAPTIDELESLATAVREGPDRRADLEDILWGLLNSKEFLFRR